ncbi:MAG: YraN family protein [Hyphomicrobiaceae bacterium]
MPAEGRHTSPAADPERIRRYRRGIGAEWLARLLLVAKGYRILAARVRTPVGEIDLIARRGRRLAFVEVKRRPTMDEALESVTPRLQTRVMRAAEWWMGAAGRRHAACEPAFDAVLVVPGRLPRHLADAFEFRTRSA